jgi:hypothetical protein
MLLTCGSLLVGIPLTGAGICMFWSRLVCFHGFIDKSVIQLWISPPGGARTAGPGGARTADMGYMVSRRGPGGALAADMGCPGCRGSERVVAA